MSYHHWSFGVRGSTHQVSCNGGRLQGHWALEDSVWEVSFMHPHPEGLCPSLLKQLRRFVRSEAGEGDVWIQLQAESQAKRQAESEAEHYAKQQAEHQAEHPEGIGQ